MSDGMLIGAENARTEGKRATRARDGMARMDRIVGLWNNTLSLT